MSAVQHKPPVHPLLAAYLVQLAANPLRTKMLTGGAFSFLQEVIGSNVSGTPPTVPPKDASPVVHALARAHVDIKTIKMALYGCFVSAPLGHYLTGALQKAFAGKTGTQWRVAQIIASSLIVSPIQVCAFLSCMAIINGAKTAQEVFKTVKAGFFSVIRVSWVVSPLAMTIAQQYVPLELWVPFFNLIQFGLGTYFNIQVKSIRLAALKKEAEERARKDVEGKTSTEEHN